MRHELYKCYDSDIYEFIIEKENHIEITDIMHGLKEDNDIKCIIIDNENKQPINHYLLGLALPPTRKEHYNIIFNCKFSKFLVIQNKIKGDLIQKYNRIYYDAILKTKKEIEKYFKKLNKENSQCP